MSFLELSCLFTSINAGLKEEAVKVITDICLVTNKTLQNPISPPNLRIDMEQTSFMKKKSILFCNVERYKGESREGGEDVSFQVSIFLLTQVCLFYIYSMLPIPKFILPTFTKITTMQCFNGHI